MHPESMPFPFTNGSSWACIRFRYLLVNNKAGFHVGQPLIGGSTLKFKAHRSYLLGVLLQVEEAAPFDTGCSSTSESDTCSTRRPEFINQVVSKAGSLFVLTSIPNPTVDYLFEQLTIHIDFGGTDRDSL